MFYLANRPAQSSLCELSATVFGNTETNTTHIFQHITVLSPRVRLRALEAFVSIDLPKEKEVNDANGSPLTLSAWAQRLVRPWLVSRAATTEDHSISHSRHDWSHSCVCSFLSTHHSCLSPRINSVLVFTGALASHPLSLVLQRRGGPQMGDCSHCPLVCRRVVNDKRSDELVALSRNFTTRCCRQQQIRCARLTMVLSSRQPGKNRSVTAVNTAHDIHVFHG